MPKWKFILSIALFRFVEWNCYAGNYYGTLKSEIRKKEKQGIPIVFDVDINGAVALKKFLGDDLITVFLNCPLEESEKRLRGRDKDVSEEYIKKRMAEGLLEVQRMEECDATIFYGFGADPNITANTIANKMLAA
jgi:guanylate kinase